LQSGQEVELQSGGDRLQGTLRNPTTMQPITSTHSFTAALDQPEVERLAFLLNPPPDSDELELVITADTSNARRVTS
jgi:hypothetical protein